MSFTETAPASTTSAHSVPSTINILVDGRPIAANEGELLVEAILREKETPHICYHSPLMGPIQTCDTCLVEVDPDKLHAVISNAGKDSPSMLAIGKQATSKDARRGMAAAVGLLNVFGEALNAQQAGHAKR